MSIDPKARREPGDPAAKTAKVQSIKKPIDLLNKGLPSNLDAERFVLGSVLLDDSRFSDVAMLDPDDFALERHSRIFRCMQNLQGRGEHIDRVTVAAELALRGEFGTDGLSFLVSLDEGIPHVPHLGSYATIVLKKSALRRAIFESQRLADECMLDSVAPSDILADYAARIEALRARCSGPGKIHRIEDLESIFAARSPVTFLVDPELPEKAVVCLTGDSESGKTTLACAWARDVFRNGHAVLILDRDKNPRDRICDRLERIGIRSYDERFRVWDCEQPDEAPQPDDPIITDWVKRMAAATGKPPLVIVDSLIGFFTEAEDENSAVDMRRLFNRCRALTRLGVTVIVIHHTNRSGEARGSSDFKPASDQAFLVSNHDSGGGRLLDLITLECHKSRYGLSGRIRYRYASGKMLRIEEREPANYVVDQLLKLLKANPGILTGKFEELALEHGVKRKEVREFLKNGKRNSTIREEPEGRKLHHFWCGKDTEIDYFSAKGAKLAQ
jgi:KaiC/GvpD/RAD55 family RecA-like ATPase